MQMASRANAAWGVAGNIGFRPSKKYPQLRRGIFILFTLMIFMTEGHHAKG